MSVENLKERMLELLADRAIFGLDSSESEELRELEGRFPELAGDASFDRAAAAYSLNGLEVKEQLPQSLRSRILADSESFFKAASTQRTGADAGTETTAWEAAPTAAIEFEKPGLSWTQWLGWGVAAAACIALAFNIWFPRADSTDRIAGNEEPSIQRELTPAEKRGELIASAGDLVRTKWSAPTEDGDVSGEVVWSDEKQAGYMTFKGLQANDVNKETYQLWIFDERQDEATPIDGGVFDISKDGEIIVPIDAKLEVHNPKMFAVTVEKPGGVVVSKREKIVAIAKV